MRPYRAGGRVATVVAVAAGLTGGGEPATGCSFEWARRVTWANPAVARMASASATTGCQRR